MAHYEKLETIKAQMEQLVKKEKRGHTLKKVAYGVSCLTVLFSLFITQKQLKYAINPAQLMEVAHYKIVQGIPAANAELKKVAPEVVNGLVTSLVTQAPEALKNKIIESTQPLIKETASILGDALAKQAKELSQNSDMIIPNKATASKEYAKVFDQLGDLIDAQLITFYQHSQPVLRDMISDIKTLKDETNLSPREELIKKILGLTLALIDKEKIAAK